MRAGLRADLGVGFCVESNVGFGAMANALCAGYTPWAAKMFRETGAWGLQLLNSSTCRRGLLAPAEIGIAASKCVQCADPSSLLLVANKIDATKTTMMTGTTKNGDVMCMAQAPCCYQI